MLFRSIRAVVVTDAMQSFIMCAGAVVTIAAITWQMGGVKSWWPDHWLPHWQEPVFWFRTDVRVTFMGAFLNMAVWMTCTAGADQMAIQRYLSTRDAPSARRSFGVHLLTELLMSLLLAIVGLAVLGYFSVHPELLSEGRTLEAQADELLPRFVVEVLPAGISGLVIAAMLSAAMSSVSSALTALASVSTMDLIKNALKTKHDDEFFLKFSKRSTVFWAAGLIIVAYLSREVTFVLDAAFSLRGLTSGALLGSLLLTLFWKRARALPVIIGMFAALAVMTPALRRCALPTSANFSFGMCSIDRKSTRLNSSHRT